MFRILAAVLMISGAGSATAQTSVRKCLTGPESEAVFLAIAPAAIKVAGMTCANALPSGALLRQTGGPFLGKMQLAADDAWPRAVNAMRGFAGPDMAPLFDSEAARPLLGTMIATLLVADLKPQDCARVDRTLTLLSPLPPRNIAALGVTILQYAQDDARRRGKASKVPMCPTNP